MANCFVGDIQGCYDDLRRLLDLAEFDPDNDTLWLCGDLVARGPDSLNTLRFVKSLGSRAVTVLGNHDLHLLAVAHGVAPLKKKDKLQALMEARIGTSCWSGCATVPCWRSTRTCPS